MFSTLMNNLLTKYAKLPSFLLPFTDCTIICGVFLNGLNEIRLEWQQKINENMIIILRNGNFYRKKRQNWFMKSVSFFSNISYNAKNINKTHWIGHFFAEYAYILKIVYLCVVFKGTLCCMKI